MIHHSGGQCVETDKVCKDTRTSRSLYHIALDNVFLRKEPVLYVLFRVNGSQVKFAQVIIEQHGDSRSIFYPKFPHARCLNILWQSVQLQVSLHRHISRKMGKFYLYQLLRVDGSVPVAAGTHWF